MAKLELYEEQNKPEVKPYAHIRQVGLPYEIRKSLTWKEHYRLYVGVEEDGILYIDKLPTIWFGKRYSDMSWEEKKEIFDYLVEWELAVWRRIGPEDSEIFATKLLDPEYGID